MVASNFPFLQPPTTHTTKTPTSMATRVKSCRVDPNLIKLSFLTGGVLLLGFIGESSLLEVPPSFHQQGLTNLWSTLYSNHPKWARSCFTAPNGIPQMACCCDFPLPLWNRQIGLGLGFELGILGSAANPLGHLSKPLHPQQQNLDACPRRLLQKVVQLPAVQLGSDGSSARGLRRGSRCAGHGPCAVGGCVTLWRSTPASFFWW